MFMKFDVESMLFSIYDLFLRYNLIGVFFFVCEGSSLCQAMIELCHFNSWLYFIYECSLFSCFRCSLGSIDFSFGKARSYFQKLMLLDIRNTNYTMSEVGSKTFRNSTVWEGKGSQFTGTKSSNGSSPDQKCDEIHVSLQFLDNSYELACRIPPWCQKFATHFIIYLTVYWPDVPCVLEGHDFPICQDMKIWYVCFVFRMWRRCWAPRWILPGRRGILARGFHQTTMTSLMTPRHVFHPIIFQVVTSHDFDVSVLHFVALILIFLWRSVYVCFCRRRH